MKRLSSALSLMVLALVCSPAFGADAGPTHHAGALDTSEVWSSSGNPHILDDDVWTGNGATLTVAPGCTVLFSADVELYTGYSSPGSIVAVGKADSMITFTSLSDTVPGFWRSIGFYYGALPTAKMSYCNVLFGGDAGDNIGAVLVDDCKIQFDHNLVRKSGSSGVWTSARGKFGDFTNNTVTGCARYAVRIAANSVPTLGAGNMLAGNTAGGVLVEGENVTTSGTWLNHGVPYVIDDDVGVGDAANHPVVTIAPGTTVQLTRTSELYVGYSAPGGLIADGTSDTIRFTSSRTPPSAGDWRSLSFYGNSIDSQCQLKNCKVGYAGYGGYGNIYITNCTPTVTGCDIGYSAAWGIYLNGSEYPSVAQLRADNVIHDYVDGDVRDPEAGIEERSLSTFGATEPATVVRGVLFMPEASGLKPQAASLLDAAGRRALVLHPGTNDVSGLAPGVYFVHEASGVGREASSVRKVILQK